MKRSPASCHSANKTKTHVDEKTLQVKFSFLNEENVKQLDNPEIKYTHCFEDLQLLKNLCSEIKGLCKGILEKASSL